MLLQKYCASKSFNIECRLFSSHSNSRAQKKKTLFDVNQAQIIRTQCHCCRLSILLLPPHTNTISLSISLDGSLSRKRGSDFDSGHFATVFLDFFFYPPTFVSHMANYWASNTTTATATDHVIGLLHSLNQVTIPYTFGCFPWQRENEREDEKPC